MDDSLEQTSGLSEARKALAQSRARQRRTGSVVRAAAETTSRLNAIVERPDVLVDRLREIIRGTA